MTGEKFAMFSFDKL